MYSVSPAAPFAPEASPARVDRQKSDAHPVLQGLLELIHTTENCPTPLSDAERQIVTLITRHFLQHIESPGMPAPPLAPVERPAAPPPAPVRVAADPSLQFSSVAPAFRLSAQQESLDHMRRFMVTDASSIRRRTAPGSLLPDEPGLTESTAPARWFARPRTLALAGGAALILTVIGGVIQLTRPTKAEARPLPARAPAPGRPVAAAAGNPAVPPSIAPAKAESDAVPWWSLAGDSAASW